ncbi:unnamed protein product [Chironomus riparius]|uniref:Uncharacterized protein n=1 Tax=Chironomus riparius TaxID=315576 RepID=A0A9N9WU26_9DIPT|nr:unnamed protein product [Chironomus riparius]
MKFLPIILFIAAIFVAEIKAGGPAEPKVCEVVAQVSFEFTSFTNNLLRLYILNLPRSDEVTADDKCSKLDGLVDIVQRNAEVPEEDKSSIKNLITSEDEFGGRALADQLTRANIWDCLVEIFTSGMNSYLTY